MNIVQFSLNHHRHVTSVRQVQLERRAEIHAALGDPARLAIVDELSVSDRSPSELSRALMVRPPLLAFHLDTLERAGLVRRVTSSGDRRRKYVQLVAESLVEGTLRPAAPIGPVLFVCTHNSARSQLAAALWRHRHGRPASSAGTEPAERIHPGAIAAAERAGLDLLGARPRRLRSMPTDRHVVTVCDRAHEELGGTAWHWSIPDPVEIGTDAAFDRALELIHARITTLTFQETA